MQFSTLKSLVAGYLKQEVSDFTINGVDTLGVAINNARRAAERIHDFRYSETTASLSITANGASLTAATAVGWATLIPIKRVRRVSLPLAGGDHLPIEFMTVDDYLARIRRQTGRTAYSPANTLAAQGVSFTNPVAYQQGQSLFLAPASQFTFPVTATLDVVQFLPDYSADTDHDFIMDEASEYLQWQAIVEGNKYWKEFVQRQEGNLQEPEEYAQMALASLIAWDESLSRSTNAAQKPAQPEKA